MKFVTPIVRLIAAPAIDWHEMNNHIVNDLGGSTDWYLRQRRDSAAPGEALIEFMARKCYRSFEPGLNPNVTRVRENRADYFENILESRHGSVLAHAHYTFVFHNVSRVFTHEIVRHAAGTDISQESMRYVRLDNIPFWMPEWAQNDDEFMKRAKEILDQLESFQRWMANRFRLDDAETPFKDKKEKTSFMRRFAPDGVATSMGMTFNVRALRHVLEMRYSEHAEEEMRVVMPMVYQIMSKMAPLLFNDYTIENETIKTPYRKV